MLPDPNWVTEDDADVTIGLRREAEEKFSALDEVPKRIGSKRRGPFSRLLTEVLHLPTDRHALDLRPRPAGLLRRLTWGSQTLASTVSMGG
jgi:hypothetical protein